MWLYTLLMLIFDVLQLCFLLSLTGGLSNPFALLVLAPVTIYQNRNEYIELVRVNCS